MLNSSIDLSGYTLIFPSVSVGNVPQLTVDLLIANFNLVSAGSIWHPALVPLVGVDPFLESSPVITTACTLYVNESLKLAAIQLRSTIEAKLVKKFVADLANCLQNLTKLYILVTGFDYELHNIAMKSKYYFIGDSDLDLEPLEQDQRGNYKITGAGIGLRLHEATKSISTVLAKFVAEGDNIEDAQNLLNKLLECLNLDVVTGRIKFPISWKMIHGASAPLSIF